MGVPDFREVEIDLPGDIILWAEEAGVPLDRLIMDAVLRFRELSPSEAFLNPSGD